MAVDYETVASQHGACTYPCIAFRIHIHLYMDTHHVYALTYNLSQRMYLCDN
jgi:hypothetical protein